MQKRILAVMILSGMLVSILTVVNANFVNFPNGGVTIITTNNSISNPPHGWEFVAQTQYSPLAGWASVARDLLVNQRVWLVRQGVGNDTCGFRAREIRTNYPPNLANSNMIDFLPIPNNPLQVYYATKHRARMFDNNGTLRRLVGYTSPQNGVWATPYNNSNFFNGRGATNVTCPVYRNQ